MHTFSAVNSSASEPANTEIHGGPRNEDPARVCEYIGSEKNGRRKAVREAGSLSPENQKVLNYVCDAMTASDDGRGNSTVHCYRQWGRRLLYSLQIRNVAISEMTEADRDLFASQYAKSPHQTKEALAKALNAVLPVMHQCGFINDIPAPLRVIGERPVKNPYVLTEAEVRRVNFSLASIRGSEKHKLQYVLGMSLLHTGLRPSELIGIRIADLLQENGHIDSINITRPTGIKTRIVISPILDEVLREWLEFRDAVQNSEKVRRRLGRSVNWTKSEFLFPGVKGGHVSYALLYSLVKRLGSEAAIKNLRPDLFQHCCSALTKSSGQLEERCPFVRRTRHSKSASDMIKSGFTLGEVTSDADGTFCYTLLWPKSLSEMTDRVRKLYGPGTADKM